ncbi:PHP domain-containing protein [Saccharibacillus sp. CPCC 101409]|uniref:PHP domain-containing protein n=1 Tax=Saccharibacillus sp. CPCC 101409 TaxID=3058041 RepID=UPI00267132F7|nr:PHP domain-containing protein [Saccharibacillus sp. CPCC 101409]MDO3409366.1 PHP domain-containing protein [Saccharibacillus sp. CPCC 101409]
MRHEGIYDLHMHSTSSDGMNTPAELAELAAERGLAGFALTDHDTVAGVPEAAAAAERSGLDFAPGVEISTRAGGKDIHMLGYFFDPSDGKFRERLAGLRGVRDLRNDLILERLRELGVEITLEEVKDRGGRPLGPGESVGRPHMADVLVRKGYADDLRDAFDKYLAEGAAAYVSPPRITPREAADWIREAGGVPVLAHPGLYGDDALVREVLDDAKPAGIEVRHPDHSPEDEARYRLLAEEYGLLTTAGSDYHGVRQGKVFHGEIGKYTVETPSFITLRSGCFPSESQSRSER